MADIFKSSQGALWVQPDGPNTKPQFLGCHDLGDITEPGGAIDTLFRCFNPNGDGWIVKGSTVTPPDPVTTDITVDTSEVRDWLERIKGEFTIFALQRTGGPANLFTNWKRATIVGRARIGQKTSTGLVRREEDIRSEMNFEITALPPAYRAFDIRALRQATSETESLNAVVFLDGDLEGFAVGDAASGSPSNVAEVLYTDDGGGTWTATSADPFSGAENISAVVAFPVAADTNRVIVARGTTDAGAPAEIAYSDSDGAAWQAVNVGSTNAQFVAGARGLFALNATAIWAVTDDGYIYKSEDGGATWATQNAGVATSNDLTHVHFVDEAVGWAAGASDTILRTTDGGTTWSTVQPTGESSAITALYALDEDRAWVGAGGSLYYTKDGGTTWTERAGWTNSGIGTVKDIQFVPGSDLVGFMLHNNASPVGSVYRTINGGYDWQLVQTTTNAGLNAVHVSDENLAFAVGEASGGTAVILKASPVG